MQKSLIKSAVIIGAGPAGIAAAIQLKRAGIDFLLLERGEIGGLLINANLVENYPGVAVPITGPELAGRFREHLASLNISTEPGETRYADHRDGLFLITTDDGTTNIKCRNLIVASGTKPKRLDPSTYSATVADKIFYEVHPLRGVKDKHIVIIGGGDAAFDYALNLAHRNRVDIFCRGRYPKCLRLLYERVKENRSISLHTETGAERIYQAGLQADYIIVAIGREPNIDFLSPKILNHLLEKVDIPGLYYAGDVIRGINRQTAIAVGDGVRAAMDIITGHR